MYFWKYILAKKAGLSQKKCNMALYGLPVLPIAEAFEKTVTGNPISVTDALAQDALSLQVAFLPTQDGTPSIDSEPTTEPYLSKVVPRGNKEYYSLVGGTVAWNQLAPTAKASWSPISVTITGDSDEWTITTYNDSLTVKAMAIAFPTNHVAFCSAYLKTNTEDSSIYAFLGLHKGGGLMAGSSRTNSNSYTLCQTVAKLPSDATQKEFLVRMSNHAPQGTSINAKEVICVDLTLMLGSTIADYVNTLETANAGSGIAWLKSYGFFTKDYYPYNPGELISVNTSGHKIGSTTYPIDNIDLRGLFKMSNGKLYCKGDTYKPDGTVTRKYGIVDLGTLNWVAGSNNRYNTQYKISTAIGISTDLVCAIYISNMGAATRTVDKSICITNNGYVYIYDTSQSGDASAFKTAMSGVYLIYPLATPTTESATPYASPIDVETGGTEEFIDNRTVPIPVGNETYYASEYEIHGKTGVTVSHGATQDDPNPTEHEVEFTSQGTVYGGTVDIVSGVLSVTWGYIASYNGETLTGIWMSSKDVYTEGTTPSTGAEVAYELATPLTYQLTPQQVQMLLGNNYLETEDGTITLTYMAGK